MKGIRFIFKALIALILLVVLAAAGLILFFNPNHLKEPLMTELSKQTGQTVVIQGDLSWQFFPTFSLTINDIALGQTESSSQQPPVKIGALHLDVPFNTMWQRQWNIEALHLENIHIQIKSLQLGTRMIDAASAQLSLHNNQLILEPIEAQLYHGTLRGKFNLQALSSTTPQWSFEGSLEKVSLAELLRSSTPGKFTVSGDLNLDTQLHALGFNAEQIKRSLQGSIQAQVDNGVLKGLDLAYWFSAGQALIQHNPTLEKHNAHETTFTHAKVSAQIHDGILSSHDLMMDSGIIHATGEGTVNLIQSQINYHLLVSSTETVAIKDVQVTPVIPLLIAGALENPDIGLDKAALTTQMLKQVGEQVGGKAQKALEKAGSKLKDLFH